MRISNASDPVPRSPKNGLVDVKVLEEMHNSHILEVYLHGIAGTHGPEEEFKLEINRDIALMNKAEDVLKDEYGVPVSWWIEKNKGMVQQEDGFWILMDHDDDTLISYHRL
ncbi:hypothetical protein P3L10_005477 [Capsicum annuum]